MKKFVKLFILLLIMGAVLAGVYYTVDTKKYEKTDAYKFKTEYEKLNGTTSSSGKIIRSVDINKKNRVKYSTAEEIVKKIDKGESFLVYFGFASCPWCRSMVENLINISIEKNIDIYYVDVLEIRDILEYSNGEVVVKRKGNKYYMELLEKLSDVLDDYRLTDENDEKVEVNEKRIYAPNVVSIINGVPKMKVEGVSDELKDPYSTLTDDMIEESKRQLKEVFDTLTTGNICTREDAC